MRRDADFLKISTLPDIFSCDTKTLYHLARPGATAEEIEWAANVRIVASSPERETTTGRRESVGQHGETHPLVDLGKGETVNDDGHGTRSRTRSTLQELETLDQDGKSDADDATLDDVLDGAYSDGFLDDDSNGDDVEDDVDQGEA